MSIMNLLKHRITVLVLRSIFGLMLVAFGVNHVYPFMGTMAFDGALGVVIAGFTASQYIMPVTGVIMLLAGLAFLTNRFVPLGALLMAPLSVNFLLIHLILMPSTIAGAALVFLLNVYLAYVHWDAFKHFFKARS